MDDAHTAHAHLSLMLSPCAGRYLSFIADPPSSIYVCEGGPNHHDQNPSGTRSPPPGRRRRRPSFLLGWWRSRHPQKKSPKEISPQPGLSVRPSASAAGPRHSPHRHLHTWDMHASDGFENSETSENTCGLSDICWAHRIPHVVLQEVLHIFEALADGNDLRNAQSMAWMIMVRSTVRGCRMLALRMFCIEWRNAEFARTTTEIRKSVNIII